jgi:hypothetical protein
MAVVVGTMVFDGFVGMVFVDRGMLGFDGYELGARGNSPGRGSREQAKEQNRHQPSHIPSIRFESPCL